MSNRCVQAVFDHSEARGNDRLVLLAIADEADDDGSSAFPSIDRIARKVRLPKRTVMRCQARLEALAELVVHRPEVHGRGHHNTYAVLLPGLGQESAKVAPFLAAVPDEETARKGAQRRATVPTALQTHRPIDPTPTPEPSLSGLQPDAERLCNLLADLIEANGSKRPTVSKAWVTEMDRLMRLDHRTPEQVERAIRWCQADTFWRANIMSVDKLRKHYDRLRLAAKQGGGGRPPSFDNTDARRAEPGGRIRL